MLNKMRNILKDEEGATMVEYALLVALIAVVAMVGGALLGTGINARFTAQAGQVNP
jgi:pilus assembly protein Flp/PilA